MKFANVKKGYHFRRISTGRVFEVLEKSHQFAIIQYIENGRRCSPIAIRSTTWDEFFGYELRSSDLLG